MKALSLFLKRRPDTLAPKPGAVAYVLSKIKKYTAFFIQFRLTLAVCQRQTTEDTVLFEHCRTLLKTLNTTFCRALHSHLLLFQFCPNRSLQPFTKRIAQYFIVLQRYALESNHESFLDSGKICTCLSNQRVLRVSCVYKNYKEFFDNCYNCFTSEHMLTLDNELFDVIF